MNDKTKFSEVIMAFCVCTTCINLLEGVLGMLLYPEQLMKYDAFFVPPLFALFSVLLGMVTWSKKELTVRQVLFKRMLHLILIEIMVFGLNYLEGYIFPPTAALLLAVGIAVVFILVYLILWLLDRRSAKRFNRQLKLYQEEIRSVTPFDL